MSKSSNGSSSSSASVEALKTGREVDSIVMSLMTHAADKDDAVRSSITFALHDIGSAEPLLVASALPSFLARNAKLDQTHRVLLLKQLTQLLETQTARDAIAATQDSAVERESALVPGLIRFCAKEMTSGQEMVTDISVPCCSCLVLLGGVNCSAVVDEILSLFPAGQLPHYYIVKCLADVAANHPVEFVQKLKEVMARMTPVIGNIKKAPMKWVFATAYGRFSEAMGHYQASMASSDASPGAPGSPGHPLVQAASFEIHMASAFDVMFGSWLSNDSDAKVKFACLESLGSMCLLLDRQALEARLPRLVNLYLTMYKKEKVSDHLSISHGLCSALKEAVKSPPVPSLVPLLQPMLMTLHPMVARPVDFAANPNAAKNLPELLRCFEILARSDEYGEQIIQFVVGRFQMKEREARLASLIILRHFVNALDEVLVALDRKPLIMSSVLTLLGEGDLLLRKTMMQLIVSMANQQYLTMEGGQQMVRFILKQCALKIEGEDYTGKMNAASASSGPIAAGSKDGASPLQIRNAGNHILSVMASKVPSTHRVLWPYFLEFIAEPDFNRAIIICFKVLETIASAKREAGDADYLINFDAQPNIPPPQALLARLMVLAAEPHRRGDSGLVIVKAIGALGPLIHEGIGKYFDESAPSLLNHLQSHSISGTQADASFNLSKWQDTLLKIWKECLSIVDNPKWIQDLAQVCEDHFALYKGDSALLRVLQRYLGCVLSKVEARAVLNSGIESMLNTVNHASDLERQGCAQGLGLCASVHLDVVLPKLTGRLVAASKVEKKSSGFFGFGGGSTIKDAVPDDKLASTLVLCYGNVAAYANPELIVSRLEVHILHNVVPMLQRASRGGASGNNSSSSSSAGGHAGASNLIKLHLIKCIDLVGKAVHPSRLPPAKSNWKLNNRDELITFLLAFLDDKLTKAQGGRPNLEVKLLGLNALSTLANLEPPVGKELRTKMCDMCLNMVALSATKTSEPTKTGKDGKPAKDQKASAAASAAADGIVEGETRESMIELIMGNLHTLLSTFIDKDPSVSTLIDLLNLIASWTSSSKTQERERSVAATLVLLKKFVGKLVHERLPMSASSIPELGKVLATHLARLNDSSQVVRQTSTENVQALLYINQVLSNPDNPKPLPQIKLLTDIRNRLEEEESDKRLAILKDMCALLTPVVHIGEIMNLLSEIVSCGMMDEDLEAAQGSALIFKTLLQAKVDEMGVAVRTQLTGLLLVLKSQRVGEVCEQVAACIRILARTHFITVVDHLLEAPSPVPREVIDACCALVETAPTDPSQAPNRPVGMEPEWDPDVAKKTLLHFVQVMNDTPIVDKKPTPIVQAATSCMEEMLRVPSFRDCIDQHYPLILSTLLLRVGTAAGVDKGQSSIEACSALRSFFENASGEETLLKKLDQGGASVWPALENADSYDEGVTCLIRCFSEEHPDRKRELLEVLAKFFSPQSYTGQRVVATAILAEFVNHSQGDDRFLREVIKFLLPRVADKVEKCRKQALRGLGHLVVVWNDEVAAMATSVLSSLTAAAEDSDADVAAEAVHSLTRIAGVVSEGIIGPMLTSICFRLRPTFDRKEERVRTYAFTLFGALCRFGGPDIEEGIRLNFMDVVHSNVPVFIVHCNDAAESVREATLEAFKLLAPLLGDSFLPLLEPLSADPSSYETLVSTLVPELNNIHPGRLRGYIENTTHYFTLTSTSMRANSAYLAGVLISTASNDQRRTVSVPALTSELIRLLKDNQPTVRSRAAKALSLCHHL